MKEKFYMGSPRISSEFRDCSMPLAFDQHKGCGYKCIYCFAYFKRYNDVNSQNDFQKGITPRVDVKKMLKLLDGDVSKASRQFKIYYKYFIKKRKVIQWGAMGDPFCPYEKVLKTGLPIIKKLADMKYPVSFSTKATWFTENDEYMNLFKQSPESFHFKFSIICSDKEKAAIIEQGVPSPEERFKAMKRLSDIGVAVTLRLRPYIIGLSDLDLEDTIKRASEAGAISVSMEFFCLDVRASFTLKQRYKIMSNVVGYDMPKFYTKNSSQRGYLRLNKQIKEPHVKRVKELCDKYGLKLYISDPDFKELSHHGSCCGLPQRKPFTNYCKAQLCELLVSLKNGEEIDWDEYEKKYKEDFKWQKEIMAHEFCDFGSAHKHRLNINTSCYDYSKNIWNKPKSNQSPYKYFGGTLTPVKLNKKNNVVYKKK